MKVLVTGASGFVGGAVMRRARQMSWEVRGVGRRPLNEPDYVSADLSQPFALDFRPDVVIHAAARSSPWGRRSDFEAQNVTATRHVLNYCATQGRPHFVHISTAARTGPMRAPRQTSCTCIVSFNRFTSQPHIRPK